MPSHFDDYQGDDSAVEVLVEIRDLLEEIRDLLAEDGGEDEDEDEEV